MKEEFSDYQKHFAAGLRVEVRFPRGQNKPFRDGAIITLQEEDLITLQISRDALPEDVRAETGTFVDIHTGKDGNAYCSRAIIVAERDGSQVTARLIGNVIPDEMREYYRIETYIPVRYQLDLDATPEQLQERWRAKRYPAQQSTDNAAHLSTDRETSPVTEPSRAVPLAANLSGSGIRIRTRDKFQTGTLLSMELYLPLEDLKIVPIIAEVVHVDPLRTKEGAPPLFSTALHFLCIDERDRDSVIRFISLEQLDRLRDHQGGTVSISSLEYAAYSRRRRLLRSATAACIILLLGAIAFALVYYRLNSPKGEIEQTFEQEIRKYRTLFPWR
ncbi:PilZ-like domain-containing protein [Geobacter grbiciae]|uniref:PilZ-like domain-containing protein n=1 Tax=Geobacter grbiciae TaxID=155042 RepID=UPI001C02C602|nr:PilZ-like domain-containing protein [Geobacter grbiciae]MBT1074383.1 DUF5634 family protein [Geobacter grbiciae]